MTISTTNLAFTVYQVLSPLHCLNDNSVASPYLYGSNDARLEPCRARINPGRKPGETTIDLTFREFYLILS